MPSVGTWSRALTMRLRSASVGSPGVRGDHVEVAELTGRFQGNGPRATAEVQEPRTRRQPRETKPRSTDSDAARGVSVSWSKQLHPQPKVIILLFRRQAHVLNLTLPLLELCISIQQY